MRESLGNGGVFQKRVGERAEKRREERERREREVQSFEGSVPVKIYDDSLDLFEWWGLNFEFNSTFSDHVTMHIMMI